MNDLNASDDKAKFEAFQEKRISNEEGDGASTGKPMEFSCQVLTAGNWPSYKQPELSLPVAMMAKYELFERYYRETNNARKLKWVFSLGTAKVKGTFGKKVYDFDVTTLQAAAILAFEGVDSLTFTDLLNKLNLTPDILKPVMHSLSCAKVKVLIKSGSSSKVKEEDVFTPNKKFSSPNRKLKIPMASLDSNHNQKVLEEDRTHVIEASIVRIMKARKTLGHNDLIAEVLNQLAFFKPNAKFIKKRIESLIDREYLERSADSGSTYNYLA